MVFALALGCLQADDALARRAPAPGGTASVAVPSELVSAVLEAHLFAPLVVPAANDAALGGRPALVGAPGFSSAVLSKVTVDDGGRHWALSTVAPAPFVATSVARCLDGRAASGFAAAALRAVNVHARVDVVGDDVVVHLDQPVFVLPALLSYCPLVGAQGAATGAFASATSSRLVWRASGFDPPPLLGALEVRGAAGANDKADVVAMTAAGVDGGGATLLAPWSDVVVLVQGAATRDADPFGLADPRAGRRAFSGALRADLLAAAWAAGRGGPTEALLPPGVAPARPLPTTAVGVERTPLALVPLPAGAPRVPLSVRSSDTLTDGVAERLAVVLRARGSVLEVNRGEPTVDAIELVRWHPPTRDPALALLAFLGERPALVAAPAVARALDARALLAADPAARVGAALALERALLDSRLVVPLLVVDRWISVDPDLRGVGLRDDGVPLLDGAWWGGGR
jgi:hypothetical protein